MNLEFPWFIHTGHIVLLYCELSHIFIVSHSYCTHYFIVTHLSQRLYSRVFTDVGVLYTKIATDPIVYYYILNTRAIIIKNRYNSMKRVTELYIFSTLHEVWWNM
jgi:hypothetical protein